MDLYAFKKTGCFTKSENSTESANNCLSNSFGSLPICLICLIASSYSSLRTQRINDIEGLTLIQNNGHGQDVKHYHLHLIPRYTHDNVEYKSNKDQLVEVEDVFNQIKD